MKGQLRVPLSALEEGTTTLPQEAARYVFRVHRTKPGDWLLLFDPETGMEAEARATEGETLVVSAPRPASSQALPIHLLQAVGKSDKPEQALRDVTVLGAERLTLVHTSRTVARSDTPKRQQRLRRVAVEAARQCGRGRIPALDGPMSLEQALDAARGQVRVVCTPSPGAPPLRRVLEAELTDVAQRPSVDVLIGPEGGLSSEELATARSRGFVPVALGPLVLRTETAATAVLSFLRLYFDD